MGYDKPAMTTPAILLFGIVNSSVLTQNAVVFQKGIKQHVREGDRVIITKVTVTLDNESLRVRYDRLDEAVIPYAAIVGMTYDRRRSAFAIRLQGMPARRQHMLTIQYKTDTVGEYVQLELPKDVASRLVATLEAKSGKPIERIAG